MPLSKSLQTQPFVLTITVLSLALAFGGGQGNLGDTLAQLTALALLIVLIYRYPGMAYWPKAGVLVLFLVLPLLLFLLPWPELLGHAGLARGNLNSLLSPIIGNLNNQGSLTPISTERALFWLLPACAVYLACLQSSFSQKKRLATVLVFWVFVGAVLGLAQKAGGLESVLYFFKNTSKGSSVGLFANANHYAISMAVCLPLIWAALTWAFNQSAERHVNPLWFITFGAVAIIFILGFMLSGSRAGLALGMFGCLLMLPAVISADQRKGAKHWMFAILAVGLFLAVQVGFYFITLNFQDNPLVDGRWQLNAYTMLAADNFAPVGSGPGSFWFVFPQYGGLFTGAYIANHAHNEYLELWLEMRWLFVFSAIPLVVAYAFQGFKIWFRSKTYSVESTLLARAAWIGLLLLIIHSSVDYPLRTTALLTAAGLLAAFILPESADSRD